MSDQTDDYIAERRFQQAVNEGLVPKIQGSAVCISLAPENDGLDAKFCVELGAMILLNKPILAIVAPGRTISAKFELVADKVVHADITTDEGQALLAEAIADFTKQFDTEETS